ncbi:MAG: hypothetical protein L6Q99_05220 [Planctomycetes bacterium]|nr:hypothetical protein [Planctomycetota bacterium]
MRNDPEVLRELISLMQRAGWDPFDPSDDCVATTDTISVHCALSRLDTLGVRWRTTVLRLFARFGVGDDVKRYGDSLMLLAPLFTFGPKARKRITPESLPRICTWFDRWYGRRFKLSDARARNATEAEIESNLAAFEPAISAKIALDASGLIDHEADLALMAMARAMYNEGTTRPSDWDPMTMAELFEWFDAATCDGGTVSEFTSEGKLRVDPLRVKTALDRQYARTDLPSMHAAAHGGIEELLELTSASSEVDAIARVDEVHALREIIATRLAAVERGSADFHVLNNFESLAEGVVRQRAGLSVDALSVASGVPASSLRLALEQQRQAIGRLLRRAG